MFRKTDLAQVEGCFRPDIYQWNESASDRARSTLDINPAVGIVIIHPAHMTSIAMGW